VVVVGEEKLVTKLGERVAIPVEVVPFAVSVARRELERMGGEVSMRQGESAPYRTDNGNAILNVRFDAIQSPAELEQRIVRLPGVADCGLFVGMADLVLVQTKTDIQHLRRK
jgi:ribose 5-phosphate isomerase A